MAGKKIQVTGSGLGLEEALNEAEDFARRLSLDERSGRRLRLLAEETLSMVRAIVSDFTADFWLESDGERLCKVHLAAETVMDYVKKQELIEASTQKKNSASVGIMGKIRDIIENSCYGVSYTGGISGVHTFGMVGMGGMMAPPQDAYLWSLTQYRQDLQAAEEDPETAELLDELEKSIVAAIADNITVSVTGNRVEMVIEKQF